MKVCRNDYFKDCLNMINLTLLVIKGALYFHIITRLRLDIMNGLIFYVMC